MRSLLTRWLMVTVALVLAGPIAAMIAGVQPPAFEPGSAGAGNPTVLLGWSLVSSGVIAAVLVGLAARSAVGGWTRAVGLFAVAFGIGHFTGLLEAYVFHVLDGPTTLRLLAMSGLATSAACLVAVWLTPVPAGAHEWHGNWRPGGLSLAVVAALYVATYFAAGVLVFPFVEAFYATRSLPATTTIVALQFFVRGPLLGLMLAWIVASTQGVRLTRALWAGAALSLLGGVAPLLMPNPYFTDAVRWAHFVETSVSNLIFGAVAGWIFTRETPARLKTAASGDNRVGAQAAGDV